MTVRPNSMCNSALPLNFRNQEEFNPTRLGIIRQFLKSRDGRDWRLSPRPEIASKSPEANSHTQGSVIAAGDRGVGHRQDAQFCGIEDSQGLNFDQLLNFNCNRRKKLVHLISTT